MRDSSVPELIHSYHFGTFDTLNVITIQYKTDAICYCQSDRYSFRQNANSSLECLKIRQNIKISLNPNRARSVENVASKIVPAGWKRFLWMFLQPRPQVATNHTYCSGKLRTLLSIFVGFDIWGYLFRVNKR